MSGRLVFLSAAALCVCGLFAGACESNPFSNEPTDTEERECIERSTAAYVAAYHACLGTATPGTNCAQQALFTAGIGIVLFSCGEPGQGNAF